MQRKDAHFQLFAGCVSVGWRRQWQGPSLQDRCAIALRSDSDANCQRWYHAICRWRQRASAADWQVQTLASWALGDTGAGQQPIHIKYYHHFHGAAELTARRLWGSLQSLKIKGKAWRAAPSHTLLSPPTHVSAPPDAAKHDAVSTTNWKNNPFLFVKKGYKKNTRFVTSAENFIRFLW